MVLHFKFFVLTLNPAQGQCRECVEGVEGDDAGGEEVGVAALGGKHDQGDGKRKIQRASRNDLAQRRKASFCN